MNLSFRCKVSLSKKLRSLIDGEGSITLMASSLSGGTGEGVMTLHSEGPMASNDLTGETSIQVEPIELIEEIPDGSPVASIFSSVPTQADSSSVLVGKIAAVHAPEKQRDASRSIKPEVETPEVFKETDNQGFKNFISSLDELTVAVNEARTKVVENIDINAIENEREKAAAIQAMERAGAIDAEAWIVNDQCASIRVNDLDISLELNSPVDLSNISAKRIAASKELKALLRQGVVSFIDPADVGLYAEQSIMGAETYGTLDVYDSPSAAEEAMPVLDDDADVMELTDSDLEAPTEEEMMINLTNIPATKSTPVDGTRVSSHGQVSRPHPSREPSAPKIKKIVE